MFDEGFFTGFDEEFRRMQEHMNRIFDEAMSGGEDHKKYVYGFTMRTGPDGKPVVEEFGNVPRSGAAKIGGEREPLVDVIDGEDEVSVIAELPGVDKKDIDLNAGERSLTISVDKEDRRYHKGLKLPADVDPDSVKATYKNGVLDVKLKRMEKKQEKKKKIQID